MTNTLVYIILFRGVGGATQLPTAPLREALTAAGFHNVATYINSGNAVLRSALPRAETASRVAQVVAETFDFTKDIHLATVAEWSDLIARNPFAEVMREPKFLHAALLGDEPGPENVESVESLAAAGEGFAVIGKVAYLHTPHGFGTSKLAEAFDRRIGVANTARNWNTVLNLAALAAGA